MMTKSGSGLICLRGKLFKDIHVKENGPMCVELGTKFRLTQKEKF